MTPVDEQEDEGLLNIVMDILGIIFGIVGIISLLITCVENKKRRIAQIWSDEVFRRLDVAHDTSGEIVYYIRLNQDTVEQLICLHHDNKKQTFTLGTKRYNRGRNEYYFNDWFGNHFGATIPLPTNGYYLLHKGVGAKVVLKAEVVNTYQSIGCPLTTYCAVILSILRHNRFSLTWSNFINLYRYKKRVRVAKRKSFIYPMEYSIELQSTEKIPVQYWNGCVLRIQPNDESICIDIPIFTIPESR